ncbi:MAG: type II toxin-antitoxin system VapC family toxin [Bacteroidetes bacterium]|nr:type II toxin-antitoxin system VapC family toxin [Bacteroidota bacterium]
MILLDSNIIIYSASEQHKGLRELIKKSEAVCSIISKLEVLGYHNITTEQIKYFEAIFKVIDILPISDEVISQAIKYRQKKSMSVGDSIIAASAKIFNCNLYTNNVEDFLNIKDFKITNPIK